MAVSWRNFNGKLGISDCFSALLLHPEISLVYQTSWNMQLCTPLVAAQKASACHWWDRPPASFTFRTGMAGRLSWMRGARPTLPPAKTYFIYSKAKCSVTTTSSDMKPNWYCRPALQPSLVWEFGHVMRWHVKQKRVSSKKVPKEKMETNPPLHQYGNWTSSMFVQRINCNWQLGLYKYATVILSVLSTFCKCLPVTRSLQTSYCSRDHIIPR